MRSHSLPWHMFSDSLASWNSNILYLFASAFDYLLFPGALLGFKLNHLSIFSLCRQALGIARMPRRIKRFSSGELKEIQAQQEKTKLVKAKSDSDAVWEYVKPSCISGLNAHAAESMASSHSSLPWTAFTRNEPPPAHKLQEWQKTRPWLAFDQDLGMICLSCQESKASTVHLGYCLCAL